MPVGNVKLAVTCSSFLLLSVGGQGQGQEARPALTSSTTVERAVLLCSVTETGEEGSGFSYSPMEGFKHQEIWDETIFPLKTGFTRLPKKRDCKGVKTGT